MDEIHPWLKDKLIKNYLYSFSFVVQVLIFKLECHVIMMYNVTMGKYDDWTKIILILKKNSILSTMFND
jgi:hypothetical protein